MFDEIDKDASTKDRQVIFDKLNLLEGLMLKFLHTNEEQEDEVVSDDTDVIAAENELFIADILNMDLNEVSENMGIYNDTLDSLIFNTIRDGSNSKLVDEANRISLLTIVAYSYERDVNLDNWFAEYAAKNNMYFPDQRKNFLHMKKDFINYIETKEVVSV